MKRIIVIVLLILVLASCKKNSTASVIFNDTSGIVGNWKWIQTLNYYLPYCDSNPMTPIYASYQKMVSFNADQSFVVTKNNVLIDSGTFKHGHGTYTMPGLPVKVFIYDSILYYHNGIHNKDSVDYYKISTDTLCFSIGLRGLLGSGNPITWKKSNFNRKIYS